MCGIVGYIGDGNVVDILLDGLSQLDYRGYDSAGISILTPHKEILTVKKIGKLSYLIEAMQDFKIEGTLGIGHTRWATHGKPSDQNAHPHADDTNSIVLVHNGIIENYLELKIDLLHKGHQFISETDSEVIAHLIQEEINNQPNSIAEAIRVALKKTRGTYALGIIHRSEPDIMYAVRSGSPLVIGLGKGENYIASDVAALLKNTRNVIYLEDQQMALLRKDRVEVMDMDGHPMAYTVREVEWQIEEAQKGGYESFMLKEIHEQPGVLQQIIAARIKDIDQGCVRFQELEISEDELRHASRIIIVGCGTAFYAGLYGKYILQHLTSIPVEVDLGSEFRYRDIKVQPGTLVIAVSQSGETADTLASIRKAKDLGCRILSIVNVAGSTITRDSHGVIATLAGPEIGVASTKAYVAQLCVFYLFSIYLGKLRGEIQSDVAISFLKELQLIPEKIQKILQYPDDIINVASKYCSCHSAFYLGRGFNYPTAREGALKNKEISYMHAEGYAAGEMKHGPIALIDESFPVVCICTKGSVYEKVISNMKEVEARNGRIIAVGNMGDQQLKTLSEDVLNVPETIEALSPILNIIPLQLLAYYFARDRGCDVDRPRNLAKSVTVE
ncbi:MAG: glutamine--fructose-6-phosphate transaminase (isomerizing) [Chlamydiota bacterium]|nr:glutamine--fructose-6-phosphate transaminase (isomerizing) [Chlamydiota bacterium]